MHKIDHYFKMKSRSIGPPGFYLGAKLQPHTLSNGVTVWGLSPAKYLQEAVKTVQTYLEKNKLPPLKRKTTGQWPSDYSAELNSTPELTPEMANYFLSQIKILHWCVEIGPTDIIMEVFTLASYIAMPREGHLEVVFHIYSYLKGKHNSCMIFDPFYLLVNQSNFKESDWTFYYRDFKEAIPSNAPMPRGKDVTIRLFVDSSHANDKKTCHFQSHYFLSCT